MSLLRPKWIVISSYVGPRKKFRGLTFPTRFTFYRKKPARIRADRLNALARRFNYSYGPGRDFLFEAVPYFSPPDDEPN